MSERIKKYGKREKINNQRKERHKKRVSKKKI